MAKKNLGKLGIGDKSNKEVNKLLIKTSSKIEKQVKEELNKRG